MAAIYYKFRSAKDYDAIPIDGAFVSVANLKGRIFESKKFGRGSDFDLVVTNAQTHEEYLDEATLIARNTSVLIRRVPGPPCMTIVTAPSNKSDDAQPAKNSSLGSDLSDKKYPEDLEWDDFGIDMYAIPEVLPNRASNPTHDAPIPREDDEDSKIRALVNTPALDLQRQTSDGFGPVRGFGGGISGRMMGGRGFGRHGLEQKTPPQGYVCHRCKVPGHLIQHCPTNGDHNYDIKRVRPPTGIPKSMLMETADGSYALPTGAAAILKPNEAAFDKEIEGLPSTRSVGELPPELHCPLCKQVMKDAALTSKCCFNSFCDKCIRNQIISKSVCFCGAKNLLADDLIPNKTVRDAINRILESRSSSSSSSGINSGTAFQIQEMESKIRHSKMEPNVPSSTLSAASQPQNDEISKVKVTKDQGHEVKDSQNTLERAKTRKVAYASDEEVQQKPVSVEAGQKKRKRNGCVKEAYTMPPTYNSYWTCMQPGMEGYGAQFMNWNNLNWYQA